MLIATLSQEGERPGQVAEAVDEAQRGGEADLEQSAEDEERPGHGERISAAARARASFTLMARTIGNRVAPAKFILFMALLVVAAPAAA